MSSANLCPYCTCRIPYFDSLKEHQKLCPSNPRNKVTNNSNLYSTQPQSNNLTRPLENSSLNLFSNIRTNIA